MIALDVFRKLVPAIGPEHAGRWSSAMEAARPYAGITTKRQVAHWLGQLCHETRGFCTFEENLSYSVERLAPTADEAKACELIALKINGGRIRHAGRWDWTQQAIPALKQTRRRPLAPGCVRTIGAAARAMLGAAGASGRSAPGVVDAAPVQLFL